MNNRDLDRLIKDTHRNLVDVESSVPGNNNTSNTEEQQKVIEIGRLTAIYEGNIHTLTNYLPNVPVKDLTTYSKHYSELEERANREVREYEDMTAIAIDNAAKAGLTNPKQEMAEFAQQCKQAYLDWLKQRQERFKQIKTIIHSDGTITSVDTITGERARFDNQFNPLD